MFTPKDKKQFWLWVTRPENYTHLKPGMKNKSKKEKDLWTCHKDTRRGDLALIWRTGKADIGFLMKAESNARSLKKDPWGCDWKVLFEFKYPITAKELRKNQRMDEWNALRADFRNRTYAIPSEIWGKLKWLLAKKNSGYQEFLSVIEDESAPPSQSSSEQLQETIEMLSETPYRQKVLKTLRIIERRHSRLSNAFVVWLGKSNGKDIQQERDRIDVEFVWKGRPCCAELKVCYGIGSKLALRSALGQLLEYNHYPGRNSASRWAIVLDEHPTVEDIEYVHILKKKFHFPLSLCWHIGKSFEFATGLGLLEFRAT